MEIGRLATPVGGLQRRLGPAVVGVVDPHPGRVDLVDPVKHVVAECAMPRPADGTMESAGSGQRQQRL
jgi:hypothetical protein